MKNRIDLCFATLKREERKGFIAYLVAGDPDLETTELLVHELVKRGADLVELGVPFSDPLADGPVIQAAATRALEKGVTLADVLALAGRLRKKLPVPLLVMTYFNPVLACGLKRFTAAAQEGGLDGVIIPDLPLEESGELDGYLQQAGLHLISFLAPTSPDERLAVTVQKARGFIYCLALAGVTGARESLPEVGRKLLGRVRALTAMPLALGFGISKPEQAAVLGADGDALIVGSALVKLVEEGGGQEAILARAGAFVESFNTHLKR